MMIDDSCSDIIPNRNAAMQRQLQTSEGQIN